MSASEAQRGQGDEIMVDSIHPHPLIRDDGTVPETYQCSGCRELGFGGSYRCKNNDCNNINNNGQSFVIHEACAYAGAKSNSSFRPRFLGDNKVLKFLEKPPGNIRLCEACRKEVSGFVYHCDDTTGGSNLHPCCFYLNELVSYYKHQGKLKLHSAAENKKCSKCKKQKVEGSNDSREKGWWYLSRDGKYYYHVACLRELVIEEWKKGDIDQDIMVERNKLPATRHHWLERPPNLRSQN